MATPKQTSMKLDLEPTIVTWPETHYLFIEKIGPFQNNAPQAWQDLHPLIPAVSQHNKITGYVSLYKMGPNLYRAGVSLAAPPEQVPHSLRYEKFPGGKYTRFVMTGPYSNLPEATTRVLETVLHRKTQVRDDYYIENYTNDPRTTPQDQLVTEILIPTV